MYWNMILVLILSLLSPILYIVWVDIREAWLEYHRDINRFQVETSGKAWEQATGHKQWSKDNK